MKKYISGDYAFFDDEKELYYCYVGFNNPKMSLELSVYGNTPGIAKQKAEALVKILNDNPTKAFDNL